MKIRKGQSEIIFAAFAIIVLALIFVGINANIGNSQTYVAKLSGVSEIASSCTANQYASSEDGTGTLTCSLINWVNSLTGYPSNCAANKYMIGVGASLTCSLIDFSQLIGHIANLHNETASSPSACANNQYINQISESQAGVLTPTCAKPINMAFTSNANTCTDTTNGGTGHMMGFATTYTTQAAPFIHTVHITLNWKITAPTTVTTNTQYQLSYGSTSTPTCNAAKTGTQIGNIYEYLNGVAQTTAPQRDFSETVVITGLTASTTYWFDLNVIDSSTASWIYSLPQISVIEY